VRSRLKISQKIEGDARENFSTKKEEIRNQGVIAQEKRKKAERSEAARGMRQADQKTIRGGQIDKANKRGKE